LIAGNQPRLTSCLIFILVIEVAFTGVSLGEAPKATDWFQRGKTEFKNRNWQEAASSFSMAIQEDSGCKDAYFLRGEALRQSGKFFSAIKDFRTVIETDAEHSEAWRSLGKVYRSLGRFDEELVCYQKAAEYCKDEKLKSILKQWIVKLQDKLKKDPTEKLAKRIEAQKQKAQAAEKAGDYEGALKLYQEGLNLLPGDASLYSGIGALHANRGEIDLALENFDKALTLEPRNVQARTQVALLAYHLGDKERASQEFEKILKEDPDNGECYLQLAKIRTEQGRREEGVACLQRALQLISDPNKKEKIKSTLAILGVAEATEPEKRTVPDREVQGSAETPSPAVQVNESDQESLRKDLAPAEPGGSERIVAFYRKAIEKDPDNPTYHTSLACELEILGNWSEAVRHYEEAVRLKPDYVDAMVSLGDIYAGNFGDCKAARKWYEKATRITKEKDRREAIVRRAESLCMEVPQN